MFTLTLTNPISKRCRRDVRKKINETFCENGEYCWWKFWQILIFSTVFNCRFKFNLAKNFPFSFFLLLYFLVGAFFIHNFILLFYMIKTKVQEVTIFLRNGIRSFHNYLNYFCNFENYFSQLNKTFFFSEQIFAKVPLSGVPLSGE